MSNVQNIYDDPTFFKGYQSLRKNNQGFNDLLEQPAMRSLLPELTNTTVLDIGCGLGDFARFVIEQGASSVVAIDPSVRMLEEAKKLTDKQAIDFQQVAVEHFQTAANSFDLIVSSLAFHYVSDFKATIEQLKIWLKTSGCFLFSIEHPICTAYPEALIKTDELGRAFHPIYNYRDEGLFNQTWFVEGVKKYHRTVANYINTLINCGFQIDAVLEPMPSDEMIAQKSQFAMHKIRPPLLIIKASKM